MSCPNCQTENPAGAKFCYNCGTPLALSCSNCGTELPAGARFCFNCGQATGVQPAAPGQPAAPSPPPPTPTPASTPVQREDLLQRYIPKGLMSKLQAARSSGLAEGERRVVTILFCDLQGSTMAAAGLDPEEWTEIVNGAFKRMIEPVYRYEGTVARLMGDGLLAFFGAPIAHEDDPQRAVLAGLDIVQEVKSYSRTVQEQWGIPLDVRIGINTGLVVVGAVGSDLRMEYTALGDAINLAARMEQTAAAGSVQIAAPTYRLIAPLFEFESLGSLNIKGIVEPVPAYRVLGAKAAPGRLRGIVGLNAPLIGRAEQMSALQAAAGDLQQGSGQIVSVMGEAGLGKSRLVAELRQELTTGSSLDITWAEGKSQSFETHVPYAPFMDLFRDYFELQVDQTDSAQLARIGAKIEELIPGQGESMAPFFGSMLDLQMPQDALERVSFLQPPQLRGSIFHHVQSLLEQHLVQQPLILFIDDLHWVDPTSLELLESLMPLVERAPLLVIAAFRPRRHEPSWHFHETAQRDFNYRYRAISVNPLDADQSQQLVNNLLAVEDMPPRVRQSILDRSEGNPFFVEEIIRSMMDQALIVRHNGHWRATQEIGDLAIPETVIGVITARLDRLEENTRQIVQAAAVLGREFSIDVLGDVAESPQNLEGALRELQRRELIREKSRLPQATYTFKHVLTQQAAYNSILLSNRRELHRRAVESLVVRYPDQAAAIAAHCLEARMQTRALPFLIEAGNHAAQTYAAAEAVEYYQQAIALQDRVDDLSSLGKAYEGLGQMLVFSQRIEEALETYEALLQLGQDRGNMQLQISALNKLASTYALHMGDFQKGDQLLAQADALVAQYNDQSGAAESALIRCQMCTFQADFHGVVTHMGNLVKVGEALGSKEYMSMGLEHVSSSLVWLTRYDEAYEIGLEALAIAREIGDREHESMLLTMPLPFCAVRNGEIDTAVDYLAEGIAIANKIGAMGPIIFGNWLAGEIAIALGDYEKALQHGQTALEHALPLEEMMPWMVVPPLGSLGSVYLHISDQFRDEIAKFHHHAYKLLESPAGALTGGVTWADLGYCAMQLGDLEMAGEAFQQGLHQKSMFMEVERPRLLAGAAQLALSRGDLEQAQTLAEEALVFAQEKKMRHMLPLASLTMGKVLSQHGDYEAAQSFLEESEQDAQELNFRPILWQARLALAELFELRGEHPAASTKRAAAKKTIQEIADLIEDATLREAYLQSTMRSLERL
ncbi:MAG: AAA family ATPase [Candidatus Promineifilaceae bacterium]|nr:AAA family ATPase [Candidatus Promineifilaceae bacterium]